MNRIVQLLDTVSYGDAVSNHALAVSEALNTRRIENEIYAHYIDHRLADRANSIELYENHEDDIIIYHLSSGCNVKDKFVSYDGIKGIDYHNITPAEFMHGYNNKLEQVSSKGRIDLEDLKDKVNFALADSDYNANEMRTLGYKCDIETVPIIINYEDYKKVSDKKILDYYGLNNKKTNIIFVGRISPNKKQEDVIYDYYYYKKYFNPDSRLILIGNYNHFEKYYLKLKKLVKKLKLDDVIFTGHIKFSEILAYYQCADLFLCESEHEGFCVPLIESMLFNVPIIAYNSSAVGETLGNAGILFNEKNPVVVAKLIDKLLSDSSVLEMMKDEQKTRLKYFAKEKCIDKFLTVLKQAFN